MSKLDYIHPSLRKLALPLDELTLDPNNARRRGDRAMETIKKSILKYGFRSVIVAQEYNGQKVIRAGNGRYQALKEMGYSHIPVIVYAEDDDVSSAFAIADNRTAELAEWDFDKLPELLGELEDSVDIADLGWTEAEIEALSMSSVDLDALDAHAEPDFDPAPPSLDGTGDKPMRIVGVIPGDRESVAHEVQQLLDVLAPGSKIFP